MKLRPYQQLIMDDIHYGFNVKNQLICTASMGAGKSVIIAETTRIYANLGQKVVILANISELIPQLMNHFDEFEIKYKVIKSGYDFNDDIDVQIYLIMEQSYHLEKQNHLSIKCDLLIKDEVHIGWGGSRFKRIYESLKPQKFLGLSGTPYDEQGFLLQGVELDELILHGNAAELTKLGFLVPLKYLVPSWAENKDYSKVKIKGNDYSNEDLDNILNTFEHTELIVKSMNEINAKSKKTLIYCNSIEHANTVFEALKKDGYKVGVVHSKQTKNTNDLLIKQFDKDLGEKDSIDAIVSIGKLTTGFNQPKANLLVLCRPTKILRLYLQILFRVARTFDGNKNMPKKEFSEVLDLSQCVSTHGFGIEPRDFIKKGERKLLDKQIDKNSKPCIVNMVDNTNITKPVEITEIEVIIKMKELKMKELDIKNNTLNNLVKIFTNTMDLHIMTNIVYEMNFRINKIDYTGVDVETKFQEIEENYNKLRYENVPRLLQTYKAQLKDFVKEKKNLNEFVFILEKE